MIGSNLPTPRILLRRLRVRIQIWRYGCRAVAGTTLLVSGSRISRDFTAGEFCYVGPYCFIGERVTLQNYVMFGPRVSVVGDDHRFDVPGTPAIFSGRPELRETVIESDVWVGLGSIVMAGVRIGRGAIIAAGAVVTRDVPPYEIWGGCPARHLRRRFADREAERVHDEMLSRPPVEGVYASRRG